MTTCFESFEPRLFGYSERRPHKILWSGRVAAMERFPTDGISPGVWVRETSQAIISCLRMISARCENRNLRIERHLLRQSSGIAHGELSRFCLSTLVSALAKPNGGLLSCK